MWPEVLTYDQTSVLVNVCANCVIKSFSASPNVHIREGGWHAHEGGWPQVHTRDELLDLLREADALVYPSRSVSST